MTENTTELLADRRPLAAGDTIHFVESGLTLDTGEPGSAIPHPVSVARGAVVVLTDNMIQNTRDRFGASWLDLVDDEEAQESRWGRTMFRRGSWPESEKVLRRGTPEAHIARDRARAAAEVRYTGDELSQARRAIDEEFGVPRSDRVEKRRDRSEEADWDRPWSVRGANA